MIYGDLFSWRSNAKQAFNYLCTVSLNYIEFQLGEDFNFHKTFTICVV